MAVTINLPQTVEDSVRQSLTNLDERACPSLVASSGPAACFAWEEFIDGAISNENTRKAYRRAVVRFLAWCDAQHLALATITPGYVGRYFTGLPLAPASKKLALASVRHFFDKCVTRHVVLLNPALSVRTDRHQVLEGKTPEITADQARQLLASMDVTHVVGLRDRAIIATLIYTAARVGAVAKLRLQDFGHDGTQYTFRFREKGGKEREIPVRHDLEQFILAYLHASGIADGEPTTPLFRSTVRKTKRLTASAMSASDMCRMVKRRLADASLPKRLSPHSFRVATITNLLDQGVPLDEVQYLAGHSDPRTTRLYDRRPKRVTRNIVERISI